ncbi:MAG: hypothetical protein DWI57_14560 [Chloroflexi bacterium]|nr:MAG: hypothetical protein DWI57_14560 [Chloroflexota bacterium]
MARVQFWSRLLPVLLFTGAVLVFPFDWQSRTVVRAGVVEQLPVSTDATTHVLSYQGRLADPTTGAPKADGSYSMTFRIYDAATGGTILWTEIKDITVSKGLFSTLLGDTTALAATIFDGNDRWLGVKVGGDTETTPRMRLAFAPYASYALNAGTLGGQNSAFYRNATNINAGTVADARVAATLTRDSEVLGLVTAADGTGSTLDADLLDGQDSAFYRNATNVNAGTLADARVAGTLTRDSEVLGLVTAADGAGSGVDADLLDGQDSAFYRDADNINAGAVPDAHIPAAITRDSEVMGIVTTNDGAGSGVDADALDGLDSTKFVGISGGAMSSNSANPVLKVTQDGTNPNHGVAGLFSSAESYGVQGETNSSTVGIAGVFGSAGLSGVMIAGKSGLLGQSDTGFGVVGSSLNNSGIFGWSTNDYAIDGQGPSTATGGVRGTSFGGAADTSGVYGLHTAGSGVVYGVRGQSSSTTGRGVYGNATAATGAAFGVYGESNSSSGRGVYGTSPYLGVYGYSTGASNSYGVYGYASAAGAGNYAGYFAGDVHVSGSLSKSSGTFRIDHPLDPENKYLSHSFVESPDMLNVYNGNVTLGEDGSVWVELPGYFQALNRDFRYQLTAIGGPGPNLYIAQEVADNRFQIAGGGSGLRVSWQVTGIRQDAFANANPVIVEQDKPENERGTYLHPELFGQDRSRGLDSRLNPAPVDSPEARPKAVEEIPQPQAQGYSE